MKTSLYDLVKFANKLDEMGLYALADKVTEVANLIKEINLVKNNKFASYQVASDYTLSSRYCPDHTGVQVHRIGENIYRCPIDGKKYDYISGFLNYQGELIPGNSVAAQTPETSDCGSIPITEIDRRTSIINKIN